MAGNIKSGLVEQPQSYIRERYALAKHSANLRIYITVDPMVNNRKYVTPHVLMDGTMAARTHLAIVCKLYSCFYLLLCAFLYCTLFLVRIMPNSVPFLLGRMCFKYNSKIHILNTYLDVKCILNTN